MFKIENFAKPIKKTSRYEKRIHQIKNSGKQTSCIEKSVTESIRNIVERDAKSFIIYGEPQSGKTEMMIALSAKLLDIGHKIIVVLLNDNVQLLNQNLKRFKESGIDPSPKNFSEILDHSIRIGSKEWIIFCKKNTNDLNKLIAKLDNKYLVTVIDDEADYASPNSKVNKQEKTKINELIGKLISNEGYYIGVTATPARLNLNNTFNNQNSNWVNFPAHDYYTGQDIFFPIPDLLNDKLDGLFLLNDLPDIDDSPKYLREAFFSFLVNVAYINLNINTGTGEKNYSMLVHTSGKKSDHEVDYENLVKTIDVLNDYGSKKYESYIRKIWEIAYERFPENEDNITKYIVDNISKCDVIVMNSDNDKKSADMTSATDPSTLFTIIIGGNIVSRGVTFNNLLSMFFTRDVKHKLQQDTYIQRARMFGSRGEELKYFELSIPKTLYEDWHKCFMFHRLALDSIRSGHGAPVWLEDHRTSAVASSSIDKSTVNVDSGEMGYEKFVYKPDEILNLLDSKIDNILKLNKLAEILGENSFPKYLLEYIKRFCPDGELNVVFHKPRNISGSDPNNTDIDNIIRTKGFFGGSEIKKHPNAIHHLGVFYNDKNFAKLQYKYIGNIRYLKNFLNKTNKIAA